jgi:hypothetical protein
VLAAHIATINPDRKRTIGSRKFAPVPLAFDERKAEKALLRLITAFE